MNTWVDTFHHFCEQSPYPQDCWIALSGGIDSVVCAHLWISWAKQHHYPPPQFIHVCHHDTPASQAMAAFCREFATLHGCALRIIEPPLRPITSEQAMRLHRYNAYASLGENSQCLLGHHLDDHIETVLFNFFRGTGANALSGMPLQRSHGQTLILRPLSSATRQEITAYAKEHNLDYVEDQSNQDTNYTRNFIRHQVVPTLAKRLPNYQHGALISMSHQRGAQSYLKRHIASLCDNYSYQYWFAPPMHEDKWLCKELIKTWFYRHRSQALSESHIEALYQLCLQPHGHIQLGECYIWSYKQQLFLPKSPIPPIVTDIQCSENNWSAIYNMNHQSLIDIGQKHRIQLKKFWQKIGVPAWLRPYTPLIFHHEKCVLVPGFYQIAAASYQQPQSMQIWLSDWYQQAAAYRPVSPKKSDNN